MFMYVCVVYAARWKQIRCTLLVCVCACVCARMSCQITLLIPHGAAASTSPHPRRVSVGGAYSTHTSRMCATSEKSIKYYDELSSGVCVSACARTVAGEFDIRFMVERSACAHDTKCRVGSHRTHICQNVYTHTHPHTMCALVCAQLKLNFAAIKTINSQPYNTNAYYYARVRNNETRSTHYTARLSCRIWRIMQKQPVTHTASERPTTET